MIIFKKAVPSIAYVTQGPINALYTKSSIDYMDEKLFISGLQNCLLHKHSTWGKEYW